MNRLRIEVIDREYAAILAAKTPAERVGLVAEATRMARLLAACGIRHIHPEWSEVEVQAEVARRILCGADFGDSEIWREVVATADSADKPAGPGVP